MRKIELENSNNEIYQKWSWEGQDKSAPSPRTSYNTSEQKLDDKSSPSALPVAVNMEQSATFWSKSKDSSYAHFSWQAALQ